MCACEEKKGGVRSGREELEGRRDKGRAVRETREKCLREREETAERRASVDKGRGK